MDPEKRQNENLHTYIENYSTKKPKITKKSIIFILFCIRVNFILWTYNIYFTFYMCVMQ